MKKVQVEINRDSLFHKQGAFIFTTKMIFCDQALDMPNKS